ncbi:hypothetical protein KKG61_01590 [bacterium]|nr:hypothetical protein [bacterium]MBU2462134.1 hypothetical protein [bacterium]
MSNISVNQQVSSLTVGELLELVHKAVREEVVHVLFESNSELIAEPPPVRNVDTIIEKMKATGKYKGSFLNSLRKGMEKSRTFGSTTQ